MPDRDMLPRWTAQDEANLERRVRAGSLRRLTAALQPFFAAHASGWIRSIPDDTGHFSMSPTEMAEALFGLGFRAPGEPRMRDGRS